YVRHVLWRLFVYMVFFFFSSRRRHTRFSRDWSSDVCSSDLAAFAAALPRRWVARRFPQSVADFPELEIRHLCWTFRRRRAVRRRSEERRVGKECRSGWWPDP